MSDLPSSLVAGYREFKTGRLSDERDRYRQLADEGQRPEVMMIACCDSRAAPETIFSAGPGEIFVVRNVANLVAPYKPEGEHQSTSAALEFAVLALKVRHVVVLGHSRCGGINAALSPSGEPLSSGDFIGAWVGPLAPLAESVRTDDTVSGAERQTTLERLSIRQSVANLRTFPELSSLESAGKLGLHGAWFDIANGELWAMNPDTGHFAQVSAETA